MEPVFPSLEVPVVKWMPPLTPTSPALTVFNEKVPEVDRDEKPVRIPMAPPVR